MKPPKAAPFLQRSAQRSTLKQGCFGITDIDGERALDFVVCCCFRFHFLLFLQVPADPATGKYQHVLKVYVALGS